MSMKTITILPIFSQHIIMPKINMPKIKKIMVMIMKVNIYVFRTKVELALQCYNCESKIKNN